MIKVTFEFETVEEALEFLRRTQTPRSFGEVVATAAGGPPKDSAALGWPIAASNGLQAATTPKKRGRQAKIKAPASEPTISGFAEGEPIPKEAAFKALENLINTKGYDAGRDVLKLLGVARFPELKPEQYASLVAACEQA